MKLAVKIGLLFFSAAAWPGLAGVSVSSVEIQSRVEEKLVRGLRGLWGESAQIGLTVQLTFKEDIVPGPKGSPPTRRSEVSGAKVLLQVPAKTSYADIATAKKFIEDSIPDLKPTVSIAKYTFEPQAASPAPEAIADRKPAAEPLFDEKPRGPMDRFASFLLPAALLFGSGLLFLGFLALALAVRGSLKSLVNKMVAGGGEGRASSAPVPVVVAPTVAVEKKGEGEAKSHRGTSPLGFLSANVKIVKECLSENPSHLVRELSNMEMAGEGLRWLMLLLTEEERAALKNVLGEQRLAQLANEATDGEKESSFETKSNWLDKLAERLTLRKVRDSSPVEAALDTQTVVALLLAPPAALIAAAEAVKDKAAWRILAEFLAREDFQLFLAKSLPDRWKTIVEATDLDPGEIQASAKAMVEHIEKSQAGSESKVDRARYFQSVLLSPAVAALAKMSLSQQDELLMQIKKPGGDLIKLIEERVWTPRQIQRVPTEYLTEFVKGLPMEHRVALVLGLPPDLADKMMEILPEGNIKVVVQDQVKRIEARGDEREKSQYGEICRGILETLREKALNREFRLLRPDEIDDDSRGDGDDNFRDEPEAA